MGNWHKKLIKVAIDNAQFYVRVGTSDKLIIWEIWKRKEYFDKELAIDPGDIVVDIGAHIGIFSVLAAQKAGKGKVYAFEANHNNYKLLLKNVALNKLKNVVSQHVAITNHNSHTRLYYGGRNVGASSLYNGAYRRRAITVPCTTLDAVVAVNKLKKIDFLKIDIEGSEFEILLNTSAKTLNKIHAIAMEYHDHMGLKSSSKDLISFLQKNGFAIRFNSSYINRSLFHTGILIAQKSHK